MSAFIREIPEGDDRARLICRECGHIAYENPKIVVGSVVVTEGRILMCRRAIEPRRGLWTLPAGYLELGETDIEGAQREAWEEAEARVEIEGLLGLFNISRIGQIQHIFRARFVGVPSYGAGPESLEVEMFAWDDIPWQQIAFPSVRWALDAWRLVGAGPLGQPARNPSDDPRGIGRLDPRLEDRPA